MPDSAGTATAMFTGVKTRAGMLGLDGTAAYNVCDPASIEVPKRVCCGWFNIRDTSEATGGYPDGLVSAELPPPCARKVVPTVLIIIIARKGTYRDTDSTILVTQSILEPGNTLSRR